MLISIGDQMKLICRSILSRLLTVEHWAENESDDEFSSPRYTGGFDATEMEFCFSRCDGPVEVWFQLSFHDVEAIVLGDLNAVQVRPAKL